MFWRNLAFEEIGASKKTTRKQTHKSDIEAKYIHSQYCSTYDTEYTTYNYTLLTTASFDKKSCTEVKRPPCDPL